MDRSLARLRPQNGAMTNSSFMTDTLQVIYLPLDPSILSTLFAYLLRSIYFFNFDISLLLVIVEAELGLKNVKKKVLYGNSVSKCILYSSCFLSG